MLAKSDPIHSASKNEEAWDLLRFIDLFNINSLTVPF